MSRHEDDVPGGPALPWFLFGLGLGAAMGILFAPQSGADTRRSLGKKVKKLRDLAEDRFDEVMDTGSRKVRKLRENLAEVADEMDDDGDEEFEPRPSRAREELERRLAAARARRRPASGPVTAEADDHEEQGA